MKKLFLFASLVFLFAACDKEKKIMREQSGVWEIKKWERITFNNGVPGTDTTVSNMGYLALTNNDLNPFNQLHYHLTYSPPSWGAIANNATLLDRNDDYCSWEGDRYQNDRLTFEAEDAIGVVYSLMFTITKSKRNKQILTVISSANTTASTMGSKEIFTLERTH